MDTRQDADINQRLDNIGIVSPIMIHIPSPPPLFVINLVITPRSWKPDLNVYIELTSTLSC